MSTRPSPTDTTDPSTPAPETTDPAAPAPDLAGETPAPVVPTLVDGAELVGEFTGSGYREPPQLVHLPHGQVVRLPHLLYLVVTVLDRQRASETRPRDGHEALAWVADAVSRESGVLFTPEHILFLIDRKLAPLGIAHYSDGTPPPATKANTFLALRFKVGVVPERITSYLGGLLAWLFHPAIVIMVVSAVIACEVMVLATQDMGQALQQVLFQPAMLLLVVLLAAVSSAFHELGHAAACRYGGVRPGGMGFGIYLVWPVFYTDINRSYRLGRRGRVRTDLGGVYFNGLLLIGITALYLATGFQPLLVVILSINLEMIQQLLPTLRFDGYYIVSDLVGIPDLFKYIGPILRKTLLGRSADERLHALKRWPQLVVTVWVLGVIPALVFQLGIIAVQIPELLRMAINMTETLAATAGSSGLPVLHTASTVVQILLLLLPVAGLIMISVVLARGAIRMARRHRRQTVDGTASAHP